MYFEDDDFLGGSPRSRFFDTIFHANRNVVEGELEKMVEWLAALEIIAEERCGIDVEREVERLLHNEERRKELENRIHSLYIEYMGQILSKSE
ncbi:MAG: DUF2018 family protein [Epsilonproteobacteria bacterium]|nr:DUF2018 domain-containing protein [Campylobacterota bacterium]NPA56544.1 DUF2018 family protein [Campylobacterota bacterium]